MQLDTATRNAINDAIETTWGTAPYLRLYNGTIPATPATALSGSTLLAEGTLPSDWMGASSSGVKSKSGTWTATGQSGAGAGTNATFYRYYDSGGTTCRGQGPVGPAGGTTASGTWTAPTTAVTLGAGNSYIVVGMTVSGTGIQAGTTVAAISGTSLTLSQNALITGSGVTLTFGAEMTLDNTSIANAQTVTVNTATFTAGNA